MKVRIDYKSFAFWFFGIGLLFYLIYVLRYAVLVLFAAAVIAIMIDPAVEWVHRMRIGRWRPGRGLSLGLLVLALVGIFGLLGWLIVPRILGQVSGLERILPQRLDQAANWLNAHASFLGHMDSQQLRNRIMQLFQPKFAGANPADLLVAVIATLIVAAYFSVDKVRVVSWIVSLLPAQRQERFYRISHKAAWRMQRWISGQALLMLAHGGSCFVAFWILQVRFFYALALFAGLINIIPEVGPVVTVILAGAVAALDSYTKMLGVIIFYVIYHNAENIFLTPRIMEARVHIPAATVVVAIVIGDVLAGVVGMLFAVPAAVLIASFIDEYVASGHENIDQIAAD